MRRFARLTVSGVILAALVAGCASKSSTPPQVVPLPTPQVQETPAPTRAQIRADLAAGYYERGQMEVALQELKEAVKLDPSNPKIYNVYGLVYAMLAQDRDAELNFRRALEIAPNDSEIRHNWGWYLCTHGRARESIAEFDLAVRNPLYRSPEVALTNAGKCAASVGETKRAEDYYRRALAVAPANTVAAYNLSLLVYKEARLDEARHAIRPIMQQNSPPAEALYLGMCIERKLGDRQAEASYASQLRNRYPGAAETKAIPGACE